MGKPRTKKQWLWEFSKRLLVVITLLFMAQMFYADIFMLFNPDSESIGTMIEQISDVFKVAVVAYGLKSGVENAIKISRHYSEDLE